MEAVLPKRRFFVSLLLVLSLFMTLVPTQAFAAAAKTVKLPKTASVVVGKKVTLKAAFSPTGSKSKITWSSSNKKVAVVSTKGVVTGKSAGTAKITAKLPNKKSATCKVTVKKKAAAPVTPTPAPAMSVSSAGIVNGVIGDKYGVRGLRSNGVPMTSLPLTTTNAPAGTQCYAVAMLDPDADNFVHWTAANVSSATIVEDASNRMLYGMVQGKNDFGMVGYGGPTPPSKHTYVITVYALDGKVSLSSGFSYAQFQSAISGHVLKTATVKGTYAP